MGCGIAMVKYLLFLFNFVIVLLGAAILGVGIYVTVSTGDLQQINDIVSSPAIGFIVIGAIVFLIAFFGCCGAIRESHCMVITYAVFLLTILIIQVALGIWVFVLGNQIQTNDFKTDLTESYTTVFKNYWATETDRYAIDAVQTTLSCCGIDGPGSYSSYGFNGTIPSSCCNLESTDTCSTANIFATGCVTKLLEAFNYALKIIGGVAIGVAVTELVGIVFALCLANSIRNDDRRGYRV